MFVRYRKILADGRRPRGVHAKIACQGRCGAVSGHGGFHGRREGQCPAKPRCRWRIGLGAVDLALLWPYRLQVQLIENGRVDGKVRQEHVATLGSVDGHLLPEFWHGLEPPIAARVKIAGDGAGRPLPDYELARATVWVPNEDWDMLSIAARAAFWDQAKPRLDRLVNRLDPKAVRLAIHQRIPWPMQAERERAEARADFVFWKAAYDGQVERIADQEKVIAEANEQIAEARENAAKWAPRATEATRKLAATRTE